MEEYALTDQGKAFIWRCLLACSQYGVSWDQLWDKNDAKAEEVRQLVEPEIGIFSTSSIETGKMLGVIAFTEILTRMSETKYVEHAASSLALLRSSQLATEANVEYAAEFFSVRPEEIRQLFD